MLQPWFSVSCASEGTDICILINRAFYTDLHCLCSHILCAHYSGGVLGSSQNDGDLRNTVPELKTETAAALLIVSSAAQAVQTLCTGYHFECIFPVDT